VSVLVGQPPRLAGQCGDQLAPLDIQGAQLVAGQALLRLADQGAELDEPGDLLVRLADQQVADPGRGRRLGQRRDLLRQRLVAVGLRLVLPRLPGGDELLRGQRVELVSDLVQIHPVILPPGCDELVVISR
jgi:hypothetical protein